MDLIVRKPSMGIYLPEVWSISPSLACSVPVCASCHWWGWLWVFRIKSGEILGIMKEAWDAKHKRTGDYMYHKPSLNEGRRNKLFADKSQEVAELAEGREHDTKRGRTRVAGRCGSDW